MNSKHLSLIVVTILFMIFISCEVIYNYDLSVDGIDHLPATKSCIEKYLPHSVDAHVGRQYNEIKAAANVLNEHEQEIIDSLKADSVFLDTGFLLVFTIKALDPENEVTEVIIEKTYFSTTED
ncbi:MAG: hypothetical protein PHE56_12210 [Bacteroidales bacterium]|nr:hypothetical protein [Bacteroidales bacterium]